MGIVLIIMLIIAGAWIILLFNEVKRIYFEELRDRFAGQALMSMFSPINEIKETTYDKAAELSYKFADAMLKAREAREKNE